MPERYRGSCLCRRIRFEIDAFLPAAAHCHCSMCRKFHGAAYATFATVRDEDFHWLAGREDLQEFTAENGTTRSFCRHCGSSLFFASPRAPKGLVEVALGTLDDAVPVVPDAHIFVASGATWTPLEEGAVCHQAGRTSPLLNKRPPA
jgi:hypothetical protein